MTRERERFILPKDGSYIKVWRRGGGKCRQLYLNNNKIILKNKLIKSIESMGLSPVEYLIQSSLPISIC